MIDPKTLETLETELKNIKAEMAELKKSSVSFAEVKNLILKSQAEMVIREIKQNLMTVGRSLKPVLSAHLEAFNDQKFTEILNGTIARNGYERGVE